MEFRDLPPRKDPRGGSPKSPYPPMPIRQFETHHPGIFNGGFWSAIIRYFASFLCGAVTAAFIVGGKSRDISDLIQWKGKTESTLERMDNDGTRSSHWRIDQENKEMAQYEQRMKALEETARKVDTLILKVEENSKKLEELKVNPR